VNGVPTDRLELLSFKVGGSTAHSPASMDNVRGRLVVSFRVRAAKNLAGWGTQTRRVLHAAILAFRLQIFITLLSRAENGE
jgi:hypothetical protein